jgi:hypothetical protein
MTMDVGCGMMADSTANNAIKNNSGAFSTNALYVGTAGTASDPSPGGYTVEEGLLPIADPYSMLPAPVSVNSASQCDVNGWSNGDLASITPKVPGIYVICGNFSGGTLPQGAIYAVTGSLDVSNISMDAGTAGVMFYMTCMGGCAGTSYGDFNMHGNGSMDISAPTSGTYQNILIYGDRAATGTASSSINGTGTMNISGAIYLPHTNMTINGNNNWTAPSLALVTNQLKLAGNATVTANVGNPGIKFKVPTLGE